MTGRCENCHAAVAEDIVIAFELGHWMFWLETSDAERVRPFVLCFLHEQHCLREHLYIADMIGMRMRYGEILDVGELHRGLEVDDQLPQRIARGRHYDRNRRGGSLGRQWCESSGCRDNIDLAADQVGREFG